MRNALRKPPRAAPSLLTIPNRDRVIGIFERACLEQHTLIAIELERRQTLTYGEIAALSVFARELGKAKIEHIMPSEFTQQQLEGGAQILGQTLAMVIRRREKEDGRRQRIAGGVQRNI